MTTDRPSLSLNVKELDSGSWVIFQLPGFTTAASGTEQSSLDALRKASATSYYKGDGSHWVNGQQHPVVIDCEIPETAFSLHHSG